MNEVDSSVEVLWWWLSPDGLAMKEGPVLYSEDVVAVVAVASRVLPIVVKSIVLGVGEGPSYEVVRLVVRLCQT